MAAQYLYTGLWPAGRAGMATNAGEGQDGQGASHARASYIYRGQERPAETPVRVGQQDGGGGTKKQPKNDSNDSYDSTLQSLGKIVFS